MAANQTISGDCEVTLDDQKLINRFARLNAKCDELQIEINNKNRELQNLEEAVNEMVLTDEALVQTGEIFAQLDNDAASEFCEEKKKLLTQEIQIKKQCLDSMKDEMSQIKVTLYAKFGSNINLEYDDES